MDAEELQKLEKHIVSILERIDANMVELVEQSPVKNQEAFLSITTNWIVMTSNHIMNFAQSSVEIGVIEDMAQALNNISEALDIQIDQRIEERTTHGDNRIH